MKKLIAAITFALISITLISPMTSSADGPCASGTPYRGCPACGTARSVKVQRENLLRNRDESTKESKTIKIQDLRNPAKNDSFYPDMAAEVSGYVASVHLGGTETANCGLRDLRDIVIELVATPQESGERTKRIILEVSPRWEERLGLDNRDNGAMLNTIKKKIEGQWVKFRGWMFYDSLHVDGSESTNPGNVTNWRATPWELHPVTWYEVLAKPPSGNSK